MTVSDDGGSGGDTALTPELAQEIASEISEIIGFNVLIADRDATVIGSGDLARLGTMHEASLAVVESLRPAAHGPDEAEKLRGVRPGMTLPIRLEGSAVGTVGLTGTPEQVQPFALVVQRQTEILLRQSILMRSRLIHDRAVAELVRDAVVHGSGQGDVRAIAYRARELGIVPDLPRVVVVFDIEPDTVPAEPSSTRAGHPQYALLRAARKEFDSSSDHVAEMSPGRVAVLHHPDATDPRPVETRCADVVESMRVQAGLAAMAGIGRETDDLAGLGESYEDAAAALRLRTVTDAGPVSTISDLRVHQLLAESTPRARSRFRSTVLAELLDEPDWPQLRDTLIAWAESGFNLVRAARRLHIHRNGLIYRLDKIARSSGRSWRDPRTGIALYVGALLATLEEIDGDP